MPRTLGGMDTGGLEQSGTRGSDSIRFGPSLHGIERAEIYLSTCAFERHRHDTYAIGITTAGVQTFHYRGSRRICLPGQLHVLHPDEAHDRAAGTDRRCGYRIPYIPPELVPDALPGRAPPVAANPMPQPGLTAGSATEFCTYHPSWFVTLCPVARCRLSPIPFSSWYRRRNSSPACLPISTSRSTSSAPLTSPSRSPPASLR